MSAFNDLNCHIIHTCPSHRIDIDGRVQNIATKRLSKQWLHHNGYRKVRIVRRNYLVHRLLAMYFIPNPNELPQIDHINGDKSDNRLVNLRWCNPKRPGRPHTRKNGVLPKNVYRRTSGRFMVQVAHNHRFFSGGTYGTVDEAVKAATELREQLCGEFAVHE